MKYLDAKFLLCPMPVIKVQESIETLSHHSELLVTCTDPGSLYDIPVWCEVHGHKILNTIQNDDEIQIKILVCK